MAHPANESATLSAQHLGNSPRPLRDRCPAFSCCSVLLLIRIGIVFSRFVIGAYARQRTSATPAHFVQVIKHVGRILIDPVGTGALEFIGPVSAAQKTHAQRLAAPRRKHVPNTVAHANLAMNAPDGQLDALQIKRFLPRQDMLINAVDERAVEVK